MSGPNKKTDDSSDGIILFEYHHIRTTPENSDLKKRIRKLKDAADSLNKEAKKLSDSLNVKHKLLSASQDFFGSLNLEVGDLITEGSVSRQTDLPHWWDDKTYRGSLDSEYFDIFKNGTIGKIIDKKPKHPIKNFPHWYWMPLADVTE